LPKRIINGQTYNTDTGTLIARAEANFGDNPNLDRPGEHAKVKVYQTRGGAFFLHTFSQTPRKDANGNERLVEDNMFEPMTREDVARFHAAHGPRIDRQLVPFRRLLDAHL
jgi:hypothetical protein